MKPCLALLFSIMVVFIFEFVTAPYPPSPNAYIRPGNYMTGENSYKDVIASGCSSHCSTKKTSDAQKKTACTNCCKGKDKAHVDGRCEKGKFFGYNCHCIKRVERRRAVSPRRNVSPRNQYKPGTMHRNFGRTGSGRRF